MSLMLGVDDQHGFVYEGDSSYGAHLVWPTPVLTPAKFADTSSGNLIPHEADFGVSFFFREDMFEPVSRIRRGRFYRTNGSTTSWRILPAPWVSIPRFSIDENGMISTTPLKECQRCAISNELGKIGLSNVVVILGSDKFTKIWSVIHVESSFSGEELVTLKARQSMGALPLVSWSKVPADAVSIVREKLDVLEDDYHRAGAESVVDRAREAATAILSGYLQQREIPGAKGNDLGKLISLLVDNSGKDEQRVVACAAEIPQRLHSRGKTAEQQKREIRPLREPDAELAMQCIGVMLCDLGWAEWR